MTRYAIIDKCSGFVWGVVDADDPIDACRKQDLSTRDFDREYEEVHASELFVNDSGYAVYLAPDAFQVDDGQKQEAIDTVEAMPLASCIRIHWTGDR